VIYLHIGTAKAGSTTIQNFLLNMRELDFPLAQLESMGGASAWRLAAAVGTADAFDYWVTVRGALTSEEFERNKTEIWHHVREEALAKKSERFVGSSEFLLGQYAYDKKSLSALKDFLVDVFGEVTIIAYLREQVSVTKSLYAQKVKGPQRSSQSFEDYVSDIEKHPALWDYASALRPWLEVFGRDALDVVCFDRKNFVGGDLLRDFLYRLKLEVDCDQYLCNQPEVTNKSPGFRALQAMRVLNKYRRVMPRFLEYRMYKWVSGPAFVGSRESSFPTYLDEKILQRVSDGNEWINSEFLRDSRVRLPVH